MNLGSGMPGGDLPRRTQSAFMDLAGLTSGAGTFNDLLRRAERFAETQRRFRERVWEPFRLVGRSAIWQPTDFRQMLRDEGPVYGRLAEALVALGWPPAIVPDRGLIDAIVEAYEEYESARDDDLLADLGAQVEELFVDHYDEPQMREIIDRWEQHPLLTDRATILRAAAEAHIEGRYELSVPAILPQVEGILAQGFEHQRRMRQTDYEEYARRLTSDLLRGYDEAANRFITDFLLAGFEWGGAPGSDLSRHAILHGYDTTYATAAKSLKAILIFDHVQERLRYVITRDDNLYHAARCPRLRGTLQSDRRYTMLYDAILEGREACPECGAEA